MKDANVRTCPALRETMCERGGIGISGARWYDPALGRFMQVDPLAEATPQMNMYHYVKNNPINRIDSLARSF